MSISASFNVRATQLADTRRGALLEELEVARETGGLPQHRNKLAKTKVFALDDWGVASETCRGRQNLLEIIGDRVGSGLLVITSQLPIAEWHAYLGDPTIADVILDRIVHSAHRINLQGESMRKLRSRTINPNPDQWNVGAPGLRDS